MQIHPHPSPNHTARRDQIQPHLIVLHFTAMATCDDALARLCAPEHEVSAHYLISGKGDVFQMVNEDRRAWHAGAGTWGGQGDVNSRSLGVELDNNGTTPFAAAQMDALERLLQGIMSRWGIPPEGVIGHSDMAPLRKADPGRRFDWRRLALGGLAVWHDPLAATVSPNPQAFLDAAQAFGYNPENGLDPVLDAFRQRFRPQAFGPLDTADMTAITDLATRFPARLAIDPAPRVS